MKTNLIKEIVEILPRGRTKYFYHKDKYAVDLLQYLVEDNSMSEIKASRFAGLLRKPIVKDVVASSGSSRLKVSDFEDIWSDSIVPYLLTLGQWGKDCHGRRWHYQTTSNDANLVLQLNFSNLHNSAYRNCVDDEGRPFEFCRHPIARWPFRTLAWARIDLSFEHGEALIEEVQTDWIRYGKARYSRLLKRGSDLNGEERKVLRYLKDVLLPYANVWEETILSAAIWFIFKELGIARIFYHTHESGSNLKGIAGNRPPRSLYEALPRKFCFKRVGIAPCFLKRVIKRKEKSEFFLLDFDKGIKQ